MRSFLAIHEITHNLAFKKPELNNYLAYIANIPIVVPYAMGFKFYHHEHHWEQGKDGVDSDVPLPSEANFLEALSERCYGLCIRYSFTH